MSVCVCVCNSVCVCVCVCMGCVSLSVCYSSGSLGVCVLDYYTISTMCMIILYQLGNTFVQGQPQAHSTFKATMGYRKPYLKINKKFGRRLRD